ncbi:DUF4919 domain-containing protein [Pontibacter kalidii]|uniref:DUF4919 domain-containing protein n=1 Tax=Pontibacter kalidii TaxID=2592049 RepID=UPI00225B1F2C|nr:DUF4919 domain-containing protein [Pontibacter kalidii]
MRAILLLFILLFSCKTFAQSVSGEQIKENVTAFLTDSTSADHWTKVKAIFEQNEEALTSRHFFLLYYAQGVKPSPTYTSLEVNAERMQLMHYVRAKRYKKAIELGENLMQENPFDLTTLVYLSMSLDKLKRNTDNKYYTRMRQIVEAILSTGDGRTPETAIKVANIGDDQVMLGLTDFKTFKASFKLVGPHVVWENSSGENLYFEHVMMFP